MLFATTNPGKVEEVKHYLETVEIEIQSLSEKYPADPDLEETGDTFLENARLKALHYNSKFGIPTLADDSGLVVPALDNQPGVHSARFMGVSTSYETKNRAIIEKLQDLDAAERTAYFACAMVFAMEGRVVSSFEKKVFGTIAEEPAGQGGFGYDPIFFYPEYDRTFAQLSTSQKNQISHRGQAIRTFAHLVETHPEIRSLIKKS